MHFWNSVWPLAAALGLALAQDGSASSDVNRIPVRLEVFTWISVQILTDSSYEHIACKRYVSRITKSDKQCALRPTSSTKSSQ